MPSPAENKARKREPKGRYGHGWGYAWPSDRRILYNRASARPDGKPWSERKALVWWDAEQKKWTGHDNPDFTEDKAPDYRPEEDAKGDDAIAGDKPFIMHPDGVGWIWVSSGLKDGPLPTHFESLESVIANPLYPEHRTNPPADKKERPDNVYAFASGDERFPYLLSTYRLTEHHTGGGMSPYLPHLVELQPELFAEISPQFADEIGVRTASSSRITTMRGIIEARTLVTERNKPLTIEGKISHTDLLALSVRLQRPGYRRRAQRSCCQFPRSPTCASWRRRHWCATRIRDAYREDRKSVENLETRPAEAGMSTTAFLTDSTLCIGCKACEVACKEWNQLGRGRL